MMNTSFNDMSTVKTENELKHTIKFQGNMTPLGDWIIATRWAWNFDKEAMGYQAFLYRYLTDERGSEAQIVPAITSVYDYEGFESQAEVGVWAMGMMLEA